MKKRMLLCAVLLLCVAASALAGGTEVNKTVEYFKKPDWESVPGVYTYGGSKRDWINGMAVAPDGRIAITGYTESSDGTLSDRTKTWRAGWVMMLDQDMNVMWNYCSRSGDADHMRYPVFHEDGTLTVVHHTEGMQLKIVRLDQSGEETMSETVMSERAEDVSISVVGVSDMGYLMCRSEDYGKNKTYLLYDWDGQLKTTYSGWTGVDAVGERHLFYETEDGYELCSISDEGLVVRMTAAAQRENGSFKRRYDDMISLEDGGVAACGSVWEGGAPVDAQGLISRWDAQGNLLFEMIVTLGRLVDIERTENGFAATCADGELGTKISWMLLGFDEKGVLCGRRALYDNDSSSAGGLLSQTADGVLICAQAVGAFDEEDVLVTLIDAN